MSSFDQRHFNGLNTLARVSPQIFEEIIDRPWVRENRDDVHHEEPLVLRYLIRMATRDESAALQVAKLPFLDTIEWGDSDNVVFLLGLIDSDPEGLRELLSYPPIHGEPGEGSLQQVSLLYLEIKSRESSQTIAGLEWVQDGLELHENQTVTLLQQMALQSPSLFYAMLENEREWMPAQTGLDVSTIRRLISMAEIDEEAVLTIIDMPFMETIEWADGEAIRRLTEISRTDPEGIEVILSRPAFSEGITNQQAVEVSLLYLESTDPEAAQLINDLEWVKDGIFYADLSKVSNVRHPVNKFETSAVLDLIELSERNRPMFLVLVSRPWLQGEFTREGFEAFSNLRDMTSRYPREASQIIDMPFLVNLEREDDGTLEMLFDLLNRDRNAFAELVSHPDLEGGITEEDRFTGQWLYMEVLFPESAAAMGDLPWIRDGLTDAEKTQVLHLKELAGTSEPVLLRLLDKPWVRDGLGEYEFSLVRRLRGLSQERYAFDYGPMVLEMVSMPFLDSVEPTDVAATRALTHIQSWGNLGPRVEEIMSHPSLRDGITDQEATIVAFLHGALHYNLELKVDRLELLDTILDPEQSNLETRVVTLPRAGEVTLAAIYTSSGTFRTLDLLEEVFRIQEDYLGQPFPRQFAGVLQADVLLGWSSIIRGGMVIANDRRTAESFTTLAHWAAVFHWGGGESWLTAGGVEVLRKETERLAGRRVTNRIGSCTLVPNMQELDKLHASKPEDQDEAPELILSRSNCEFILGGGFFEELENGLGSDSFQQKFIKLEEKFSNSIHDDKCSDLERRLCYVKQAFVVEASAANAAIATKIIERWYYGDPLGKGQ